MPFFHTADRRLFYRDQGSGPLLLLLPGNTASSASYQSEQDYFSQWFRVVALDFWGMGQSERCARWPADWWEQNAHDAWALLDHLKAPDCIALGSSGGAVVALLLAIHAPDRVRAVVADSGAAAFSADHLHAIVAGREQPPAELIAFWRHAHGDDWSQVVAADSAFLMYLAAQGGADWSQGRLPQVGCPVLFTASLRDSAIPEPARQALTMAAQISGSQVFLVNAGDHPLLWTCPDQFRVACQAFLSA
jgi:pimeloyl-ACP methyl ester carboxylesterase